MQQVIERLVPASRESQNSKGGRDKLDVPNKRKNSSRLTAKDGKDGKDG